MALPDFNAEGLLPEGVHLASAAELKERFVTPFAGSAKRQQVFDKFCQYQTDVAALSVHVTQWVDGSFVDRTRFDPDDVDAINFCDAGILNAVPVASQPQLRPLLDGRDSTKTKYDTHTFLVIRFPVGHPYASSFEQQRKYWRDWFSRPQDYSGSKKVPAPWRGRKGIVQMKVGDVNLCPIVNDAM